MVRQTTKQTKRTSPRSVVAGLLVLSFACALGWSWSALAEDAQDDGVGIDFGKTDPSLATDADIASHMRSAIKYARNERFQDSAKTFQEIIDESVAQSILITRDGKVYEPVRYMVERRLAEMPEVLEAYQLLKAGDASGLLKRAQGDIEEQSLGEIVRRFYLTSYGDDAAFRLGCLLMDRYEFVSAKRMLARALEHPMLSIPKSEIWLRLAVCAARLNDVKQAQTWYKQLSDANRNDVFTPVLKVVASELKKADSRVAQASTVNAWLMEFGTPARRGRMPGLSERAWKESPLWSQLWDTRDEYPDRFQLSAPTAAGVRLVTHGNVKKQTRGNIVERWRSNRWLPTGSMLYRDGNLFFRTHACVPRSSRPSEVRPALVCVDAASGRIQWLVTDQPPKVSVTTTRYIRTTQNSDYPMTAEEILLFGDQVLGEMSIHEDILFTIEGQAWTPETVGPYYIRTTSNDGGAAFGNRLVAVSISKEGRLAWSRKVGDNPENGPSSIRSFRAAPVPAGNAMVVPVEYSQDNGLYLLFFDAYTGEELKKTYLCSTSAESASPWQKVGVAVDGNDIYVASGRGFVFAVSAVDGEVRWASRYERSLKSHPSQRFSTRTKRLPAGFLGNTVVPTGGSVVVMPADSQRVIVFDRHTGELRSQRDDKTSLYCLGATEDGVVTAGNDRLRRYRVSNGRLSQVWEKEAELSVGRGVVTSDGIYLPENRTIVRRSLEDGGTLGVLQITKVSGDEKTSDPVGNILCTGDQFFIMGMERVYSTVDVERQLVLLDEKVGRGDIAALEQRARLRKQRGQFEPAADDLRRAVKATSDRKRKERLRASLLEALLLAARENPRGAEKLLVEAESLITNEAQRIHTRLAQAAIMARNGKIEQALEKYFEVAADPADAIIASDSDARVSIRTSILAGRQISELLKRHPQSYSLVDGSAEKALEQARKKGSVDALVSVYRAFDRSAAGTSAMLAAAEQAGKRGNVEIAELLLRELAMSENRRAQATGWAALATFYESNGWKRLSRETWLAHETRYANLAIDFDGKTTPFNVLARERIAALAEAASEPVRMMPQLPLKNVWKLSGNQNNVVDPGPIRDSEFLQRHGLFLSTSGSRSRLVCHGGDRDKSRWEISFKGPSQNRSLRGRALMASGHQFTGADMTLLRDGHILLNISDNQLDAYGLINGKTLWSVKLPGVAPTMTSVRYAYGQPTIGEDTVAIGDGVVVARRVEPGGLVDQITVLDARTGKRLWEKSFSGNDVTDIAVAEGFVCTIMGGDTVLFHDRMTAEVVGKATLRGRQKASALAWLDGGVAYQDGRGINFVRIPSGKRAWATGASGIFAQSEMLDDELCYMVLVDKKQRPEVLVVDMATGKLRAKERSDKFYRWAPDVGMDASGRICIIGVDKQQRPHLLMLDKAGRRLTEKPKPLDDSSRPYGSINVFWAQQATAGGDLIPVLNRESKGGGSNAYLARFFSKSKMKAVPDAQVKGPRNGKFERATSPPAIFGNTLYITSSDGTHAYVHDDSTKK